MFTDACQLSLRVTSNNIKYTYDPHNSSMLQNAKLVSVELLKSSRSCDWTRLSATMVSPAMLQGMNTEIYGEGHPFGDPSWYQAYNTPYYNDTHKQFRKLMREYVDEHIMSNVHDWDEKGTIPKEMYLEAGKQGTLALCIGRPWPEKYFGPSPWGFEPDYFHELIMYDEMSRTGSVGFQWGVAGGTTIGLPPVYHHGSEELKNRVMPPCVKGEKVCCLAITEPTAGSDVANLKCTAKLEGDYYILNGEKKWITNGIFADYFTVACRTGKPGVGGISLLLVEKGMEGLETRKMKCSGAWSSGTTYITFDDVKVPKGNLLGKEGKGFQYMQPSYNSHHNGGSTSHNFGTHASSRAPSPKPGLAPSLSYWPNQRGVPDPSASQASVGAWGQPPSSVNSTLGRTRGSRPTW